MFRRSLQFFRQPGELEPLGPGFQPAAGETVDDGFNAFLQSQSRSGQAAAGGGHPGKAVDRGGREPGVFPGKQAADLRFVVDRIQFAEPMDQIDVVRQRQRLQVQSVGGGEKTQAELVLGLLDGRPDAEQRRQAGDEQPGQPDASWRGHDEHVDVAPFPGVGTRQGVADEHRPQKRNEAGETEKRPDALELPFRQIIPFGPRPDDFLPAGQEI